MADTVRYVMEEMVPELEDLEKRGFFTKAELRSIVKKRTNCEYALKRRAARVSDFMKYIEYEIALEELRSLRGRMMGSPGKRSLADYCIVRRIHFILERATRKFRGDLRLWVRWLDFCRASHSSRQTSRVLAKALKLHPTVPGLWTRAAAWEFEHKRDASAARKLMQRGLRMCPHSRQLWAEYFHFELLYAAQLRARRTILGLPSSGGPASSGEADDGDMDDKEGDTLEAGTDEVEAAAAAGLLRGAIAQTVFEQAEDVFPEDLDLPAAFLRVLDKFDFEGKAELEARILSSIEGVSGQEAEKWDMLARRVDAPDLEHPESLLPAVEACFAVYENGVKATPSVEMFVKFLLYLHEKIDALCAAVEKDPSRADAYLRALDSLASKSLDVHQRSVAAGAGSGLHSWADLTRRCGLVAEAKAAVAAHSLAAAPPDAIHSSIHVHRLELAAVCQHLEPDTVSAPRGNSRQKQGKTANASGPALPAFADAVDEALQAAAQQVGQEALWLCALELVAARGDSAALTRFMTALEASISGTAKGPMRGGMGEVAAAAVEMVHQTRGLDAARAVYRRLLSLPPAGGSLFHALLDLELDAAAVVPGGGDRVEALFEAAVGAYGDVDADLWLRYVAWAQTSRTTAAKGLYWRAKKALLEPSAFVIGHQAALLAES